MWKKAAQRTEARPRGGEAEGRGGQEPPRTLIFKSLVPPASLPLKGPEVPIPPKC